MHASSGIERPIRRQVPASHLAAEQRRVRRPEIAAIAEGEPAGAAQTVSILGVLAMAGRDHEPVLVIGDREVTVHLLDLVDGEAHLIEYGFSVALSELASPVINSHAEQPLERGNDR